MTLPQTDLQRLLSPRYQLLRELGGGGMATVFLAEDSRHRRQVAIKVLRPEHTSGFATERFLREIEISARLQHPRMVPLLDSGQVGSFLYIVMPYIEGESLRDLLRRQGRLPVSDAIRVLIDVADALAYAHGKGVIHRDIKPDNILLAGRHALVADFGVAKAVSAASAGSVNLTAGTALGTPAYMAPEQVSGSPELDHRVDLYALGVTAYELLAGEVPFQGPSAQAVLAAQLLDDPPPIEGLRPDLPVGLGPILMRLLAKDPAARWASAAELVQALEPLARPSGDTPPAVRPHLLLDRWWWGVVAVGALLLVLVWLPARRGAPTASLPQRQVTFSGMVAASAISPDGRSVAFAVESAGSAQVIVQDLAGGPGVAIAAGRHFDLLSWSGDGSNVRMFSIENNRSVLHVIPRQGGTEQTLFAAGWSSLSPDGSRVATVSPGSSMPGRIPFYIRTLATGDTLRVPVDTGCFQSPPAWSPDGTRIAWAVEGIQTRRTRIVVLSTTRLVPTVAYQDSVALGSPVWEHHGSLLFLRSAGRTADLLRLEVDAEGRGDGPPTLVAAGLLPGSSRAYTAFYQAVSAARTGAVLYTRLQGWSNIEVSTFEAAARGEPPRRLSDGNGDYLVARFASDGRSMAVIRNAITGTVLEVLPMDGSGPREVGRIPPWHGFSWSPSGNQIAAILEDPDSGLGLRVFQLDQSRSRSYLYGRVGDSPEWLDDSTLVTPGPGGHGLLRVRLPLGQSSPVPGVDTVGQMLWQKADPEGRRLAVVWDQGTQSKSAMYLYTFADSSMRVLSRGRYLPVRWSADGRALYLVGSQYFADTTQLFALPVDGGPLRLLGRFPPEFEVQDVSPDGQGAALIRQETRSDAWLIDRHTAP